MGSRRGVVGRADDRAFWGAHIRIALALYALCNVAVWAYAARTGDAPHRWAITALAGCGLVVALLFDRHRAAVAASPHRMGLLYAFSGLTFGFVTAACLLDGGAGSPLSLLAFVALGYVSLAYPPHAVMAFSVVAVGSFGFVAGIGSTPVADPHVVLHASALGLTGVLGCLAARNQARSRRDLTDMADRLERLALIDHLTGCLNQRALWDRLDVELSRATRGGGGLCLLIVDVDHFKVVNDTYGHPVGDRVLGAIGTALLGAVRLSDVVGRVGGDEFVVVLPEAAAPDARLVAERIVSDVAALDLRPVATVTVSIGLAELADVAALAALPPGSGGGRDALYEAADRSLYAAKRAGRHEVGPVHRLTTRRAAG